jgi:hypothetical protein
VKNNRIVSKTKDGVTTHYGYCDKCWLDIIEIQRKYWDDSEVDVRFNVKDKK